MLTHQAVEEGEFSSNVLFVKAHMAGLIQDRMTNAEPWLSHEEPQRKR